MGNGPFTPQWPQQPQTGKYQLEHAREVWKAEEENARRLATRKALIIGVPLAFMALSGSLKDPAALVVGAVWKGQVGAFVCMGCSALVIVSLVGVVARAFPIRKFGAPHEPFSSELLNPLPKAAADNVAEEKLFEFFRLDDEQALRSATGRLLYASRDLTRNNEKLQKRLRKAMGWVVSAIFFSTIAGIAYVWVAGADSNPDPPRATPEQYDELPYAEPGGAGHEEH